MANIKHFFNPEINPVYQQLIEQNPNIAPSLFVKAAIASHYNQALQSIEVKLKEVPDKLSLLNILQRVQLDYSNQYTIYGKKIEEDKTEEIVQLTLKEPSKLPDLAREDYVEYVREAKPLPEGSYFHVDDLPDRLGRFIELEQEINRFLSEDSK